MKSDGDEDRRDRLLQEHLEGKMGEEELRHRLRESEDRRDDRLGSELAAYRAVWHGLAEEPESRLTLGFARRVARAAAAERKADSRDWFLDILSAASLLVPAAAGAAGLGVLLPAAGVEVAPLLTAAGEMTGRIPAGAWAAAGSTAVLFAADRVWTAHRLGSSGRG